jgi:hypothetical protein
MHRSQIEALKRAEKEAAARVQTASKAEPYDPARYKKALMEWQSARVALRSMGINVREAGPAISRPGRKPRVN